MSLPSRSPTPPKQPQSKPKPADRAITFSFQICPAIRLAVPVSVMAEIEDPKAISSEGWSAFGIRHNGLDLKVGNGNRVYAIFKLSAVPGHGGILRDFKLNIEGPLEIGIQLKTFDEILRPKALSTKVINLYHCYGDNHLSLTIGSDPTGHMLPILQLNEKLNIGVKTGLWEPIFGASFEPSMLMNGVLKVLSAFDHKTPVEIRIRKDEVKFSAGQQIKPFSYNSEMGECKIEMLKKGEEFYEVTMPGINLKPILEACKLVENVQLLAYKDPDQPFITWCFPIKANDNASGSGSNSNIIGGIWFLYYPTTFKVAPPPQEP